jgi:nucleoid DNA-binding protein
MAKRSTKARTRATPKAAAKAPKIVKINPARKPRSKGEFFRTIAESTELSRKQVVSVFETMSRILSADLSRGGPGICNVAGLMKVTVVRKPATKARKGINPFTKEEVVFKAKPARNVVKIRPLKSLKGMV